MKILVVGKGNPRKEKHAEHDFEFINTPGAQENIPESSNYDLVLFHLGHDCTEDGGSYAKVLDSWKNQNAGKPLTKVIAIGGGGLSNDGARRLRQLGNVPFIGSIDSGHDVLRLNWAAIPIDSKAKARELAERLKKTDPALTALYILCQGFLLAFLRMTPDGAGYEVPDQEHKWKAVNEQDVESIKSNLKKMHLDSPDLSKRTQQSTDGGIAYWSSVCTELPACNNDPCGEPATCDVGKWLREEFGPLQMENTRRLIDDIRLGLFPAPVVVAEAGVELARLHQVIPATQSQEPR